MIQRRGFTLVEVLLALVIMGLVTGAIYKLLNTNQRLSVAQAEQVTLQSNVRTGSLIVPGELRELNTVWNGTVDQNDVIESNPDNIRYRAMRGMGFLCQDAAAGDTQLFLTEASWTGLRDPNAARDDIYLFIDAPDPYDDDDDTWAQLALTGVTASAACGTPGYQLTVAAIPADVPANTPVRVFEEMKLELYPDDGQWWLGVRSFNVDPDPVPVLGPLTVAGFGLDYLDSTGVPTVDKTAIKSVRLTVRGLTDGAVRAGGTAAMGHPEEELVTQVLLRNSIRP